MRKKTTIVTTSVITVASMFFTTVHPIGDGAVTGTDAVVGVGRMLLEKVCGEAVNRVGGIVAVVDTANKHVLGSLAVGLRDVALSSRGVLRLLVGAGISAALTTG